MDPNTGRLRALSKEDTSIMSLIDKGMKNLSKDQEERAENLKGLELLPDNLQLEAIKELAGRDECYIDLKSDSKLTKWAIRHRKNKKKIRRKMAKQSRKINRKKK